MRYLLILILVFGYLDAKEATVQQLFNVQTVKVKEVVHAKTIKGYGFVKADDSRVYDVSPRFGGYVEALYADKIYAKVKKAQALVKVYSPEVLKAKEDYLNSIKYSKIRANKSMLESAKKRLELLNVPNSEINAIKTTKKASSFTTIFSPTNGYVFKKSLNNDSAFNAKSTLFEIVNLDKVWVEVKVHQDQLSAANEAAEFIVSTPSSVKKFNAKRKELYPQLDKKEESFTLRLEVDNKDNFLKPGMYVDVDISSNKKAYLTLPSTAVIRKNAKFFVFAAGEYEGEYEPKEIEVESLNPSTYIVKSGLDKGDEVVNNALFMMDSDAQINSLY